MPTPPVKRTRNQPGTKVVLTTPVKKTALAAKHVMGRMAIVKGLPKRGPRRSLDLEFVDDPAVTACKRPETCAAVIEQAINQAGDVQLYDSCVPQHSDSEMLDGVVIGIRGIGTQAPQCQVLFPKTGMAPAWIDFAELVVTRYSNDPLVQPPL